MSAFGDRRLLAKAAGALLVANLRFWPTVAPLVRAQLKRWEDRAHAIDDTQLRALALEKLEQEHFNAEVASTLATLSPRKHRRHVVQAIVAYEVIYDYLDGLTELPTPNPLRDGHDLYRAFTNAITPLAPSEGNYYAHRPAHDSGYLNALVAAVQEALAQLPARAAVTPACESAATRCAEAQVRAHAADQLGTAQLRLWATKQSQDSQHSWREFLAGSASSVLAVHALIAAAADTNATPRQASQIDALYLSICAISTLLDILVDYEQDLQEDHIGYRRFYDTRESLTGDLVTAARHAAKQAAPLRNGAHHLMTLAGVASYYLSAPAAKSDFAAPISRRIEHELQPLIIPTLAVMRTWRLAKRARTAIHQRSNDQ